jgi:hypothetical protein
MKFVFPTMHKYIKMDISARVALEDLRIPFGKILSISYKFFIL